MTIRALLYLGAVLFGIGCLGLLIRRNAIVVFMCIEIMMNGINLTLLAFAAHQQNVQGLILAFFVLIIAAAEAVIGLSIIVMIYRLKNSVDADVFGGSVQTAE